MISEGKDSKQTGERWRRRQQDRLTPGSGRALPGWERPTKEEGELARSTLMELVFGGKWAKLPRPLIVYDLHAGLVAAGETDDPDEELLGEYLALTLIALQDAAGKRRWYYVCQEESGDAWRFRPQHASTKAGWQIEPIPNGEDVLFASRDFTWGVYGACSYNNPPWWSICVFGERMLAAFAKQQPRAFSQAIIDLT
jgi:hypothetical protein